MQAAFDRRWPAFISRQKLGAPRPRVAYLTNAYPKVSHSFIRREIQALERQGFDVMRISIRPCEATLPDAEDRHEAEQTSVLLDGYPVQLVAALIERSLTRPARFLRTLGLAISTGFRSAAGVGRSLAYLAEACRLSRLLQRANIRHVHVHFGTNPAAVARLTRHLSGITYSMTLHGPDEFDAPQSLLLAEKIANASFVVAVSSFGRGQLMRWSPADDWPKIKVIRCGVDRQLIDSPRPVNGAASLNWPRTLVCVARLSAQKGLSLLMEAIADVAQEQRFQVRIVGDGELRPQLEAQIAAFGLGDRVTLLGWRDAQDVRKEILNARALILPSVAEGLPVVLMEAMALGRPVVATCIAGIPELVDERCGWLVPAGSSPALAEALREALACPPSELASMGAEGRARVLRHHNAERNAMQLAALLRPLATRAT